MFLVKVRRNAPSPRQSTPSNNQRRISGLWNRISNRFPLQSNSIEPFRAQRRNLLIDALFP